MALSIKHPEADHFARELAAATGETLTEAVVNALRERLIRQRGKSRSPRVRDELRAVRERCTRYRSLMVAAPTRSSVTMSTGCRADGHRHLRTHRHPGQ